MSEIIYLNIFPVEIYPKTFLSCSPNIIMVMPVREEIRVLLEKVRGARFEEERQEAERKIVEESIKRARWVAEIAGHIAEEFGLAEEAFRMRDYEIAYKALHRANELRREFERVCEEDREWTEAFWKVMREEI